MTHYINVPLSDKSYQHLKQWAEAHHQEVGEAIAHYLAEWPPLPINDSEWVVRPAANAPEVAREELAYIKLYPQLQEEFAGQYVAIYQGELIDHDTDYGALLERIDARYPDEFVWLTPVIDTPIQTIHLRSPRLERV